MTNAYIYGAGLMGRSVVRLIEKKYKVIGFLDKNRELENTTIDGIKVFHPENIENDMNEQVIVAMSARPYFEIKEYLRTLGFKCIETSEKVILDLYPDTLFANIWQFKCVELERIEKNSSYFEDAASVDEYKMAADWFNGFVESDYKIEDRGKYFPTFLRERMKRCSCMAETAFLNGEYAERFLKDFGDKVYSFVLTSPEMKKSISHSEKISLFEYEAGERGRTVIDKRMGIMIPFTDNISLERIEKSIDEALAGIGVDYLRIYSMSPVMPILKGAERTITENRPIMAINIGHYCDDFLNVPEYLKNKYSGYRFFFRMHSFHGNDCILYAVPDAD